MAKYLMRCGFDDIGKSVWKRYCNRFFEESRGLPCVVLGHKIFGLENEPREWIEVGLGCQYRDIAELVQDRPQLVDRCTLMVDLMPRDERYKGDDLPEDVRAVAYLNPTRVLYRGAKSLTTPRANCLGSVYMANFLQTPSDLGYVRIARAQLSEDSARFAEGWTLFQIMERADRRPQPIYGLPTEIQHCGLLMTSIGLKV